MAIIYGYTCILTVPVKSKYIYCTYFTLLICQYSLPITLENNCRIHYVVKIYQTILILYSGYAISLLISLFSLVDKIVCRRLQ